MRSKSRRPAIGLAQAALLSAAALMGAGTAFAQADAHPAAGVLKVKNVRIEQATAAQIEQASRAETPAGMRAYVDPVTGALREQTPEEAVESGAAAKSTQGFFARKSALAAPWGGIMIEGDESTMVHSIASKDASGRVRMQCVTGNDWTSALRPGAAKKEHGHAH